MKETELAAAFIAEVENPKRKKDLILAHDWDVYQEVDDVDIVMKAELDKPFIKGIYYHAVETKVGMSFKLLDQAIDRIPNFHFVSVCIPKRYGYGVTDYSKYPFPKDWLIPKSLKCVLDSYGIGLFQVGDKIDVIRNPKYNHDADVSGLHLYNGHKNNKAGSTGVKKHTYWKQAILEIDKVVFQHPDGIRLKDIPPLLPQEFHRVKHTWIKECWQGDYEIVKDSRSCIDKVKGRLVLKPVKF